MNYISVMFHHLFRHGGQHGAFLLAGGEPGKRFALPNAEVMIHQPSGGAQGITEIQIVADFTDKEEIK